MSRHRPGPQAMDRLYAGAGAPEAPFRFDARVADVFPDMIRRSVPGYGLVLEQIGLLAERYARPDSRLYDLGCSLGAATLAMRRRVRAPGCRIVAVDASPAMVERCRRILARDTAPLPVEVHLGDLREFPVDAASVVVMNYTLQFVPPPDRAATLRRIHAGLRPGGALLLAEKIRFDDPEREALNAELHHAFKRANGYSELEIARKRSALEAVLLRDRLETHEERLLAAGFRQVETWFRCYNFAALLALR